MEKTKFERITDYETAVIELERAEYLFTLLFEENDNAISASLSKQTWRAQHCCDRASISEALFMAILRNISEAKDILNTLIKEKQQ